MVVDAKASSDGETEFHRLSDGSGWVPLQLPTTQTLLVCVTSGSAVSGAALKAAAERGPAIYQAPFASAKARGEILFQQPPKARAKASSSRAPRIKGVKFPLHLTCPHCGGAMEIRSAKQVRCGVFLHAVLKNTGRAVPPHTPKTKCERLVARGKVWGCGRPFRLDSTLRPVICDYI